MKEYFFGTAEEFIDLAAAITKTRCADLNISHPGDVSIQLEMVAEILEAISKELS